MKIVGFTGMPGSGKSEAMAVAKEMGFPVVRMGDLIWDEVARQGLPRASEHVGKVATAMRQSQGEDIWALRTVERVRAIAADSAIVLIDGVRSMHEADVFHRELGEDFKLIAIHTDQHQRFNRMTNRARDDDPDNDEEHSVRDEREMGWGIARSIALADDMLVNEGTLDDFRASTRRMLESLAI